MKGRTSMEYEAHDIPLRFEALGTFQVAGLQITCHPSLLPTLMPLFWQTFTGRLAMIDHHLGSDTIFKVRRQQHSEEETHCVCVAVSSPQDLPAGMVSFEVPAQTYAVFRYAGGGTDLTATYQNIERWLANVDHYRPL